MTQPWPPASPDGMPASTDVLADSPQERGGRTRRVLLVGVAAVAALGVGATAWATASFLSGGGAQPEDVLPANVLAVAKVDLDPAASQKLAAYRLAQRFPSLADRVSGQDGLKDDLLAALFEGNPDLDYATDIRPWVGDRAALAAVPVAGEEPQPLAAIAYTDRAKAEQALRELQAADEEAFFAFSERADYVLLGTSQAAVDAAAGTSQVLADSSGFSGDVEALDGDQVVTAWADLGAVWQALPEELRAQAQGEQAVELSGRVVVGGRATSDAVEVVGRTFGVQGGAALTGTPYGTVVGAEPATGMVQALPADTVAAFGLTGLGAGLSQAYADIEELFGLGETADALELQLPEDFEALFGEETVFAAFGEDDVAARSRTDDPERAQVVADKLFALFLGGLFGDAGEDGEFEGESGGGFEDFEDFEGEAPLPYGVDPNGDDSTYSFSPLFRGFELPGDQFRVLDDGLAVGTTPSAVDKIAGNAGGLGDSPVFRKAVPDADGAGMVLFVDVARAVELAGGAELAGENAGDVEALEAVGFTAVGGEDGAFRLRLTVK